MKTVWQRMEELLDAGALGEPVAGSAGRVPRAADGRRPPRPGRPPARRQRRARLRAARRRAADDGGRDHEAPDRARRRAGSPLAARWNGMPGRSDLVALVLVATEGDEAGLGVLVPARPARGRLGRRRSSTHPAPARSLGHNVKEIMRSLLPLGIDVTGLEMDTAVAAYLLDASTGEYELSQLREQTGQLSLDIVEPGETARDMAQEAAGEAADVAAMATGFRQRLATEDMVMLHDDIETPLVRVLAKMEVAGIGVDRAELQAIADSLKASAAGTPGRGARAAPATSSTSTPPRSCARCSTTSSA